MLLVADANLIHDRGRPIGGVRSFGIWYRYTKNITVKVVVDETHPPRRCDICWTVNCALGKCRVGRVKGCFKDIRVEFVQDVWYSGTRREVHKHNQSCTRVDEIPKRRPLIESQCLVRSKRIRVDACGLEDAIEVGDLLPILVCEQQRHHLIRIRIQEGLDRGQIVLQRSSVLKKTRRMT